MAATTHTQTAEKKGTGRKFSGTVLSTKMKDTVVVSVVSFVKHPKYRKFIKRMKKYHAHDAGNTCEAGQKVTIQECAPISKTKHFIVVK